MKKIIALLLVLVMALSLVACAPTADNNETTANNTETTADNTETTGKTESAMKSFTVTVVYADGTSKDFKYESDEEFVGPVLQADGLIEGKVGQYGLEISTVDGIKAVYAEDGAYWAVYEGEEYAMQGIDTTPIVDGGVYKLVYTLA